MKAYASVDACLADHDTWTDEVAALRAIALASGLTETVKWGQPCYTHEGKNILILGWRKDYAIASFFKGALLTDPRARFVQAGQLRSARYLPYTSVAQIAAELPVLQDLLTQAIAAERAGRQVAPSPDAIEEVAELSERLRDDPAFQAAFNALTPGRRRQYQHHFAGAKQASTRTDRIDRCADRILQGKGLHDCVCGRTQRPPRCDGTHRTP